MNDPYNYPFIQKDNTMYLSTIGNNDFPNSTHYARQSTFLRHDIHGTAPKVLIPKQPHLNNFSLSTYVEPIPDRNKHINKKSDPLYIDDIEGSRPKAHQFRTRRVVDPLCPKYLLPTASEIMIDNGRNFIRDTLTINDINNKEKFRLRERGAELLKEPVFGSQPSKLTKQIRSNQRLEVKDINKDGIFETKRQVNPLNPSYNWRDEDDKINVNTNYGQIKGCEVRTLHPQTVNRQNNLNLNVRDIEGTMSNSCFAKAHFLDKRREFRNYMNVQDIDKAGSSSLKKGIDTKRQVNPLMPNYQFPGRTQPNN